jgi:hypothetical protein
MYHRWHGKKKKTRIQFLMKAGCDFLLIAPANGNGIFWYSFNYGGVHVIQMSSEHDWTRDSPQYKWIEEDLKKVDRNDTPWIVLTAHRMMVS